MGAEEGGRGLLAVAFRGTLSIIPAETAERSGPHPSVTIAVDAHGELRLVVDAVKPLATQVTVERAIGLVRCGRGRAALAGLMVVGVVVTGCAREVDDALRGGSPPPMRNDVDHAIEEAITATAEVGSAELRFAGHP